MLLYKVAMLKKIRERKIFSKHATLQSLIATFEKTAIAREQIERAEKQKIFQTIKVYLQRIPGSKEIEDFLETNLDKLTIEQLKKIHQDSFAMDIAGLRALKHIYEKQWEKQSKTNTTPNVKQEQTGTRQLNPPDQDSQQEQQTVQTSKSQTTSGHSESSEPKNLNQQSSKATSATEQKTRPESQVSSNQSKPSYKEQLKSIAEKIKSNEQASAQSEQKVKPQTQQTQSGATAQTSSAQNTQQTNSMNTKKTPTDANSQRPSIQNNQQTAGSTKQQASATNKPSQPSVTSTQRGSSATTGQTQSTAKPTQGTTQQTIKSTNTNAPKAVELKMTPGQVGLTAALALAPAVFLVGKRLLDRKEQKEQQAFKEAMRRFYSPRTINRILSQQYKYF